ncbi:hypothetical protein Q8F55_001750 [Vanrija albida]|uniref:Methyltransferase n=1 Tax=Vanrija albida TaxID=181172 RepID=A0ABR3Q8H2_9TREE
MTVTTAPQPSTHASFRYLDPATTKRGVKPWAKVDSGEATSYERIWIDRPVYNARDEADEFRDVDKTGFAFHTSPSAVDQSAVLADKDDTVLAKYYPEIERALRTNLKTGSRVTRIIPFDHTIRIHDPNAARQPVQSVHVDQTPAAAEARVRRHAPPEDVDELLKHRYQLINVWRPLEHAASDFPLGVIDWRTANVRDLVPVDLLYPKRKEGQDLDDRGKEVLPDKTSLKSTDGYEVRGETYSVKPVDSHRFYYVKDMTPDEIMFIKCFDSKSEERPGGEEGLAGFTPHTAFIDPNTPKDAKPRQSIEVRTLVFYEDDE